MGIFDKLFSKKQEEETNTVTDGCILMLGDKSRKATAAFRAKGLRSIINVWSGINLNDLVWPAANVGNLTVCKNHTIPLGVINYDDWYNKVLLASNLNRLTNKPEVKTTCTPSEKIGMILLHWDSVSKDTCIETVAGVEKALIEWS